VERATEKPALGYLRVQWIHILLNCRGWAWPIGRRATAGLKGRGISTIVYISWKYTFPDVTSLSSAPIQRADGQSKLTTIPAFTTKNCQGS
jgi:hypothetical protein